VVVGFHRQIVAGLFAAIIIGLIIAFLFLWRFVGRMIRLDPFLIAERQIAGSPRKNRAARKLPASPLI
jgi:uncharacterized membrane protein YraQ (UPF0718 family)